VTGRRAADVDPAEHLDVVPTEVVETPHGILRIETIEGEQIAVLTRKD
jgi:hypothetical protein